jgi:hypothetical protein
MTRLFLEVSDNGNIVPTKRDCDRWSLAEDGTVTVIDVLPAAIGSRRPDVTELRSHVRNVVRLAAIVTTAPYAQEGASRHDRP